MKTERQSKRLGGISLAGHWWSWADISTAACLVTVAGSVVIRSVGSGSLDLKVIAVVTTGMLSVVFASRQSTDALESLANSVGRIKSVVEPDEVFRHACWSVEDRKGWKKVRIYAPYGVWLDSEWKDTWLSKLEKALKEKKVHQLWGVYGLPAAPDNESFYCHARRRLELLKDACRTELHFLPPTDEAHPNIAPGFGLIAFEGWPNGSGDQEHVLMCLSQSSSDPTARSGFIIESPDVGSTVEHWFDSQIFEGISKPYLLKPASRTGDISSSEFMEAQAG